jgi:hypothetical protein
MARSRLGAVLRRSFLPIAFLPIEALLLATPTASAFRATQDPPAAPTPPAPKPGPTVDENDDNDNAARRSRVNSTAKLELAGGTIQVIYPLLSSTGPDAAAVTKLADGEVLELTRSMALKLKTDVELRFDGGAVARPGNVSAGYPGVYSLWLRRTGDGWSMVLNREPDIWGTMRDPTADIGSTPLEHWESAPAEAAAILLVELVALDSGGRLSIAWGLKRWAADFTVPDPGQTSPAGPQG